ncbi:hypothetical protein NMY22_g5236 [Coprinellus aureogranulatus]|nr:hypothetical protein NMY22_g5236 [Coprinellus aureogranulatus]
MSPNQAEDIVGELQEFPLCASKDAIIADDAVVMALFAPAKQIHLPGCHHPQSLSLVFNGGSQLLQDIYQAFQHRKPGIDIANKSSFFYSLRSLHRELVRSRNNRQFRAMPRSVQALIEWCLQAYSMILSPSSFVRLRTIPMGPTMQKGFAIFARYDIADQASIWELIGMMPGDNRAKHTNLSSITPHPEQNQHTGVPRILFGPLRMVNHRCKSFNIAFMAIRGTSAFVAYAVRDIAAGEELTVSYGNKWFGESSCPCADCHPDIPQQPSRKHPLQLPVTQALHERALAIKAARRLDIREKIKCLAKARNVEALKERERERKRRNKQRQRERKKAAKENK